MTEDAWVGRPRIRAENYGLPLGCPKCDYRWLKLPGLKTRQCPVHKADLVSMRKPHGLPVLSRIGEPSDEKR